jgi:hypothetical protein
LDTSAEERIELAQVRLRYGQVRDGGLLVAADDLPNRVGRGLLASFEQQLQRDLDVVLGRRRCQVKDAQVREVRATGGCLSPLI